ncbi:MAG: DUF4870 domain-containing protein [Caldilineaceae bacterium]|nr:DUF4870 domain-containing protein [Caldilineaceae bacterium]
MDENKNIHSEGEPGGEERRPEDPTIFERAVGTAREQAAEAADSLRRGELLQDAAVDPDATDNDRLIAMLCYVSQILLPLIMPLIVLISESSKRRPFQRYHAVQSLALLLTFIGISIVGLIGSAILQIVPLVGTLFGLLLLCLTPIFGLMALIALLYYGLQAYNGKRFAIPGLTSFLRRQGWL